VEQQGKYDYHSAYFIALQADLRDYLDELTFEQERYLNTEPLRIDALIVKKKTETVIKVSFADNFRWHNIVEFKSIEESLSLSSFYKAVGYALIYQHVANVSHKDITLTVICARHPRAVIYALSEEEHYRVEKIYPGVFEVYGLPIPIRIVSARQLPPESNSWIANLRKDVPREQVGMMYEVDYQVQQRLDTSAFWYTFKRLTSKSIEEGEKIMAGAREVFTEWALEEGWFDNEITKRKAEAKAEGKVEGKAEGEKTGFQKALSIIRGLQRNIPLEQLAFEANMTVEEVEEIKADLLSV
jgi:hypothetical protein